MPIVNVNKIIGGSEKEPEPIISSPRSNGVDIYNGNGEKVGNVPYGQNGITGGGEKVYQGKDEEGKTIYSADPYKLNAYISFDENTGKIVMHAPQEFFDSDVYSTYFKDDVISGLSKLYSQNRDAKVEMADGTQKTVRELIDAWNADLPKLVRMQQDYTRMGKKIAERLGDEAAKKYNLGTYQIMNTSAYSGKDNDYISLPKTIINDPNWSFFKEIEGFDGDNLVISKGDFVKGYYHLDASRDIASDSKTSISRLKKEVANRLANYDGDDVDEFARLIAFNNFLNDETQEGASNAVDGAFYDKMVIGGAAISEAFARNTAKWATEFVNFFSKIFLAPFSAVDLIATGKWNSKNIVDEIVNTTGEVIGEDLTPNAESVAEFLQNEENRRGEIFSLTNSTMGLIYNLAGTATYVAENVLGTIALNRLVINSITLAISGRSVWKSIPTVVDNLNKLKLQDQYGNAIHATRETVTAAASKTITESGVPQAVSDLLTGSSKLTTWQKINLIGSLNPSDVIAGAAQWNNFVGKAGLMLKTGALDNMKNFQRWYEASKAMHGARGDWRTVLEVESQFNRYRETLSSVYVAGRELWLTSAKMVTSLERFAKYIPTAYYAANVIIGTAVAEADTFRMIMDGVDTDEERSQLWSMVGRTALGWTIGMVAGSIVNKVFNGTFDAAIESANAGATEKVAKGVNIVSGRINQVRELLAGKEWIDNVKNPVKKAAIKYNQALQKSQEYLAKAADAARAAGVSEAEARAATIGAIEQMRENQNKIDFAQNPNYLVDAWNSEANPAYFAATMDATGLEAQSSRMLSDLGLANNVETTALIGGVASNGTDPQEVVNYKVRALQRMGAFRDDYDYTSALVEFNSNLTSADITSMYVLKSPSFIRERDIAKAYMADFEEKYPKVYTDFIKNKWAPAMLQMSYQFRQIEMENGYYLRSREEGWKATGMFGKNNELWFPIQRVTDAQKDFEEAARNPLEIIKKGAVKRHNYDPEHYSPGSDEMTDFVHPMITWKMYEYQRAVAIAFNDLATANFMNPYVKQVTKLDGAKVGAAKTYDDLKPTYSKSVIRAMDSFKTDLEKTGFANDLLDKQKMETKIRNAQKAVNKARETWEGIPDIDVTINNADRSRTIDTLPEDMVDEFLNKLQVPFEGEKVDIRKWLNNKMKMSDILNWDLLGRSHTNGLFPGGLYSGMPATARAYSMDIDTLEKLLDITNIPVSEANRDWLLGNFDESTNGKYKGAVIPLKKTPNSIEGTFFSFYPRGGVSFGNIHKAPGDRELKAYLDYLKSMGAKKVPVAISDDANLSEAQEKANTTTTLRSLGIADEGLNNIVKAIDKAIATGKDPVFKVRDLAAALYAPGHDKDWLFRRIRKSIPESSEDYGVSSISDEKLNKLIDKAEKYDWTKDKKVGDVLSPKSLSETISDALSRGAKKEKAKGIIVKMSYADRKKLANLLSKSNLKVANPYVLLYSIPKEDTNWTKGDKVFTTDEKMAKKLAKGYNNGVEDIEIIAIPKSYITVSPMALNAYGEDPTFADRTHQIDQMDQYGNRAALVSGDIDKELLEKGDGKMVDIDLMFPNNGEQKIKNTIVIMYNEHYPDAREASLNDLANMYITEHGNEIAVESPLESGAVTDITDEMTQAMAEYGKMPLYHNQHAPLGSIEFNQKPPEGEGRYTAREGIGDALWIAPNSSYTDEYGPNKVIADIPFEYLMTDKEMKETVSSLSQELTDLLLRAEDLGKGNLKKAYAKIESKAPSETLTGTGPYTDVIAAELGLREVDNYYNGLPFAGDLALTPGKRKGYYIDDNNLLYESDTKVSTDDNGTPINTMTFRPLKKVFITPENRKKFIEEGIKKMSKKDRARMEELEKIVYPKRGPGFYDDEPKSYRALAEYVGKPVIDTTRDMMHRGITGTAQFYYTGVDPEFDEKIGSQLASQALLRGHAQRLTGDEITKAMAKYDGMSLADLIELADVNQLGWMNELNKVLEDFNEGHASSGDVSEAFSDFTKAVASRAPGTAQVLQETFDNNTLRDFEDMKFRFWDSGTGYHTITDEDAELFLKEVGAELPSADGVDAGQQTFGDYMELLSSEIPAYTEQDLADMRLRDLERKRKILKKELKELCK